MNRSIKISDDLELFTGDLITLRADDGTFLKRYDKLEGHSALFTYLKKPDDFSSFVVEVIGSDKIRLIAENGRYLKRFYGWNNMSFVSMDSLLPDDFSVFTIRSRGGSKVTLQAENGNYLKRYFGYNGLSLITIYQSHEDPFSVFQVSRGGTRAKEAVKEIKFNLESLTQSTQPFSVGTQTLTNNSDEAQTMNFKVSKTVATEKSFNWGSSIEIGAKTEFSCGVPMLAEGKVEVSTKIGFSVGGSRSDSDSQTLEATFPVNCRGNTVMRAEAIVQLGRVDVPYEATISRYLIDGDNTTTEYTYLVKGTYHGTNAFNLTYVVNEVDK